MVTFLGVGGRFKISKDKFIQILCTKNHSEWLNLEELFTKYKVYVFQDTVYSCYQYTSQSMCVCVSLKQDLDNSELVKEIDDHIESLRDSIGWAHDNINECLTNIVHLEETKVSYY